MDRFGEVVQILRMILDGDANTRTTITGRHYASADAPSTPGALQVPFPLTVAAGGRRGLGLVARYGQQWVTIGPTGAPRTPADILEAVRRQTALLIAACDACGRDPSTVRRVLLWTPTETVISSLDQFDELVAPYEELGIGQFVLHHPAQTGPYGGSVRVFETIAMRNAGDP
jgi:alkanesulfonate monooxygenase SsuD/methylene tetrahydromethanopterin reductase-like flavin-dependent oxidoreductase (luciferase family)